MAYEYKHIQVQPIGGRIGAEIQGVKLSADQQIWLMKW